ncbi:hypothetical protein [Anthocerotibacter panamensis]|uniref:hypothetical protein n=1 Tax=Anthocerotibacter panamensis TaxID=2857077 RepID=UPI001C405A23|nr:hypothetical protein [Anthocerotibacter panamensis]
MNFDGGNQEQVFNSIVDTAFRGVQIREIECPTDAYISKDFYGRCGEFQGSFSEFAARFERAVDEDILPLDDWWRQTRIWMRAYIVKSFLKSGKQNQWLSVDFEPYSLSSGLVTMSMSRRAVSEKQSLEPTPAFLKRYEKEFRALGEPLMTKSGAKLIPCPQQIHKDYITPRSVLVCGTYGGAVQDFYKRLVKESAGILTPDRDEWERKDVMSYEASFGINAHPTRTFYAHLNPPVFTGPEPVIDSTLVLFDIHAGLDEPKE